MLPIVTIPARDCIQFSEALKHEFQTDAIWQYMFAKHI